MIKPLVQHEMNLNLSTKEDKELEKHLDIITDVNKLFCKNNLTLEEGEFLLECLLHGVREIRYQGFINFNDL